VKTKNNAHIAIHGMIVALVFSAIVAVFLHEAPHHVTPTAAISVPSADCLPSGSGGPCIPFDQIQKMMRAQPDASDPIPAKPATANEEQI
jgi:hypothetical protein